VAHTHTHTHTYAQGARSAEVVPNGSPLGGPKEEKGNGKGMFH